jgi:ribosomal protein L11 methylase PrmA
MQMGAALATGIDIDPEAITSASENLLLNGLRSNQMPVFLVPMNAQPSSFPNAVDKSEENKLINNPDLKSSRGTYDVVAANILLNPLLELVEDIVGYAKPGGVVAISGILEEQVKEFDINFLTSSCLLEFICLFICSLLYFLSHNSGAKSQRRLLNILIQRIGI